MSQEGKNDYQKVLKSLCVQDESQLKEMYHDLIDEGGLEVLERLFSTLDEFLAEYEPEEDEDQECHGISDEEDYKQVDDAQRAREARAINRGEF